VLKGVRKGYLTGYIAPCFSGHLVSGQ